jgi:hypothetical protein
MITIAIRAFEFAADMSGKHTSTSPIKICCMKAPI